MPRHKTINLSGWGRYPWQKCDVYRPESQNALTATVTQTPPGRSSEAPCGQGTESPPESSPTSPSHVPRAATSSAKRNARPPATPAIDHPTVIARGLGRSYGDSSLNPAGVILQQRLDRMLDFDPTRGLLTCEAGVSLADIIHVCLPQGWFLPVTPGTKFVTVGGAIAADVHGKNHHRDGSFGRFVEGFTLLMADGRRRMCRPDGEAADLFWATVGGMGLTGIITDVALRLRPVRSGWMDVQYSQTRNLDETLHAFTQDHLHTYSVAWVDCLADGPALGRSVMMRGEHADPLPGEAHPLRPRKKSQKAVPFTAPSWLLNRRSISAFNTLFYERHATREARVDYDSYFYPLDGIAGWNRLYGKHGFVQFQAWLPPATSGPGLRALLSAIGRSGYPPFLAVMKSCGPAGRGVLSFLDVGHTLALDLPVRRGLLQWLPQLDRILLDHGGRLYLAKDATMSAATFAAMYPRAPEFREIKRRIDPAGRFASTQSRRVGLTPAAQNDVEAGRGSSGSARPGSARPGSAGHWTARSGGER